MAGSVVNFAPASTGASKFSAGDSTAEDALVDRERRPRDLPRSAARAAATSSCTTRARPISLARWSSSAANTLLSMSAAISLEIGRVFPSLVTTLWWPSRNIGWNLAPHCRSASTMSNASYPMAMVRASAHTSSCSGWRERKLTSAPAATSFLMQQRCLCETASISGEVAPVAQEFICALWLARTLNMSTFLAATAKCSAVCPFWLCASTSAPARTRRAVRAARCLGVVCLFCATVMSGVRPSSPKPAGSHPAASSMSTRRRCSVGNSST